mgnify:CR=1 FL=1
MASCVFAAIPDSELAIGGITIGSSADYVQSIYGEPTHISDKVPNAEGGYSYSYAYGSSFYIFFDANTNVVTGIFSTANNGWYYCFFEGFFCEFLSGFLTAFLLGFQQVFLPTFLPIFCRL